jgi:hypothetical protein
VDAVPQNPKRRSFFVSIEKSQTKLNWNLRDPEQQNDLEKNKLEDFHF